MDLNDLPVRATQASPETLSLTGGGTCTGWVNTWRTDKSGRHDGLEYCHEFCFNGACDSSKPGNHLLCSCVKTSSSTNNSTVGTH